MLSGGARRSEPGSPWRPLLRGRTSPAVGHSALRFIGVSGQRPRGSWKKKGVEYAGNSSNDCPEREGKKSKREKKNVPHFFKR